MSCNTASLILAHANRLGDRPALSDASGKCFLWRELPSAVASMQDAIAGFPSDRPIAHSCGNSIADVVTGLAIASLSRLEAAIDSRASPEIQRARSHDVGASWFSDEAKHAALATAASKPNRQLLNLPEPVSGGYLLWTSGTTADPKPVHLSHEGWLFNAAAKLRCVPQSITSTRVTLLPISHAYARTCDLGTWLIAGGHLVLGMGSKDFHLIRKHAPTHLNLVPKLADLLADMVEHPESEFGDVSKSLETLGVGGAALDQGTYETWSRRNVAVTAGYGLTESGPVVCSASPQDSRPGTVGGLVNGWEHRIVAGELWIRGPAMMIGYYNDKESTDSRVVDGWLKTGDEVAFDDDGHCRVLGRIDQVIVMHDGNKIHPETAERSIREASEGRVRDLLLDSPDGKTLRLHVEHREGLVIPNHLQRYEIETFSWDPPVHPSERNSKGSIRRDILNERLKENT